MDVDDLRSELARRAEQMPAELGTAARMAAVRRRVRARRQRLAGGVVGVAVLGVGVVALVPAVVDRDTGQVVAPAAPTQMPSGEQLFPVTLDPGSWPSRIDGNSLLAGRISEPGNRTATWRMTVPTLDVGLSIFCRIDTQNFPRADRSSDVNASITINGRAAYGTLCSTGETLESATRLSDLTASLRSVGVRPGKPFTVQMSVKRDGVPVPVSRALLGVGIYAQDGEVREIGPGVSLQVLQGVPGDEARLAEFYTGPVTGTKALVRVWTQRSTPAGSTVSYGWAVRGSQGTYELLVDGRTVERSTAGGVSTGEPIEAGQELVLKAQGGAREGTLFLALYEPVDLPYTGSARR